MIEVHYIMSGIRFENVSKQYAGAAVPAVFDVNLQIDEGSFVVLLGPSGCGKTTLLKMVNRLYEPTSGAIFLNGDDIRSLEVTTLRRRIGYVIQQVGLFPHMSVAKNIAVVPELLGWDEALINPRVDELLDLVNLSPGEFRNRYPSQLSGGQQQRVGLARALAADPQVLLMDEPFGAIDAITRTTLQDEVLHLQRRLKKTVLFVTHDVEEALRLADRIVVMRAGRVVQYDTPGKLLTHPADEFVGELLNSDDRVRQFGLLRVESVMEPLAGQADEDAPRLDVCDDLRRALSLLLSPAVQHVIVQRDGADVGQVTLDGLRSAGESGEAWRISCRTP